MNKKEKIVLIVLSCPILFIVVLYCLVIYQEPSYAPGTKYDRHVGMEGATLHETEIEKLIEEITVYASEIEEGVRLNSVMFYVNQEETHIEACRVQYKMNSIDGYRGRLVMRAQLQNEKWEFIRAEINYYEGEYKSRDLNVKDVAPTLDAGIAYLQDNQFGGGNYSSISITDRIVWMSILEGEGENMSNAVEREGERMVLELKE